MIKLLKILTQYWKGITTIIGICGAVIGGYKYLEGIPKRAEEQKNEMIEVVKAYADTTSIHLFRVESALYEHGYKLNDLQEGQTKLKSIITREFAKTMTSEQVLEMMNAFEVKKNNIQTPSPESN